MDSFGIVQLEGAEHIACDLNVCEMKTLIQSLSGGVLGKDQEARRELARPFCFSISATIQTLFECILKGFRC